MTPEAEIIAYALAHPTCDAERGITADGTPGDGSTLVCSLPPGHDGPVHYDCTDGVLWVAAQQNMTREQAETLARRIREGLAA